MGMCQNRGVNSFNMVSFLLVSLTDPILKGILRLAKRHTRTEVLLWPSNPLPGANGTPQLGLGIGSSQGLAAAPWSSGASRPGAVTGAWRRRWALTSAPCLEAWAPRASVVLLASRNEKAQRKKQTTTHTQTQKNKGAPSKTDTRSD